MYTCTPTPSCKGGKYTIMLLHTIFACFCGQSEHACTYICAFVFVLHSKDTAPKTKTSYAKICYLNYSAFLLAASRHTSVKVSMLHMHEHRKHRNTYMENDYYFQIHFTYSLLIQLSRYYNNKRHLCREVMGIFTTHMPAHVCMYVKMYIYT